MEDKRNKQTTRKYHKQPSKQNRRQKGGGDPSHDEQGHHGHPPRQSENYLLQQLHETVQQLDQQKTLKQRQHTAQQIAKTFTELLNCLTTNRNQVIREQYDSHQDLQELFSTWREQTRVERSSTRNHLLQPLYDIVHCIERTLESLEKEKKVLAVQKESLNKLILKLKEPTADPITKEKITNHENNSFKNPQGHRSAIVPTKALPLKATESNIRECTITSTSSQDSISSVEIPKVTPAAHLQALTIHSPRKNLSNSRHNPQSRQMSRTSHQSDSDSLPMYRQTHNSISAAVTQTVGNATVSPNGSNPIPMIDMNAHNNSNMSLIDTSSISGHLGVRNTQNINFGESLLTLRENETYMNPDDFSLGRNADSAVSSASTESADEPHTWGRDLPRSADLGYNSFTHNNQQVVEQDSQHTPVSSTVRGGLLFASSAPQQGEERTDEDHMSFEDGNDFDDCPLAPKPYTDRDSQP